MNLVGKIFTVLIFLMCVVFGTFALMVHGAHKNWKVEVVALNDQLTAANKDKKNLEEEKVSLDTALKDEKARTLKRLVALENEKNLAVAERDANAAKIQEAEDKARRLVLAIEGANKNLAVLQTAIDGMRKDIKVTVDERNSLESKLVNTTDDLQNAVNERAKLEKLGAQLAAQINQLKQLAQYFKLTQNSMAKTPPTDLEGEVTSAPRPDVVEISVGADDGVRKGHKFVVTRPSTGKYIGIIEVIQVDYGNRAVCRPESKSMNDQIQRGDHVKAYTKPT